MKLAIPALVALSLAWPVAAQHKAPASNNPQELISMEDAWAKAAVSRDAAALARIIAPDWKGQNEHGKIMDRAAMIKEATAGDEKLQSMVNHDLHVRFLGNDHAIVQGMDNETGIRKGKPVKEVYSWTDIYEKRGGKWVAVASQNTPVK